MKKKTLSTGILSFLLLAGCNSGQMPVLTVLEDKDLVFVEPSDKDVEWERDRTYAFRKLEYVDAQYQRVAQECYGSGNRVYLYGNDISLADFESFFESEAKFTTASNGMADDKRVFLDPMEIYAEGDIVAIGGQKDYEDSHVPSISFCHAQKELEIDAMKRIVYNDFVVQEPEKDVDHPYGILKSLNAYGLVYYLYPENDPSFESFVVGGAMVYKDLQEKGEGPNLGIGTNILPLTNGLEDYRFTEIEQECRFRDASVILHGEPNPEEWNMEIRNADALSEKDVSGIEKDVRKSDLSDNSEIVSWKNEDCLLREVILPWGERFSQPEGSKVDLEISLQATFRGLDTGSVSIALKAI